MQFHWLLQWPMSSVSCLFVIKDNDGNKQVAHHGMALFCPSLMTRSSSEVPQNMKCNGSQITPGECPSKCGNWSRLPWSGPKKLNSQFITITLAEHSSKWKQSSSCLQAEPVNDDDDDDDDDQGFKKFNLMKFIFKKLTNFSQKIMKIDWIYTRKARFFWLKKWQIHYGKRIHCWWWMIKTTFAISF
jgi:hypothetical protein